MPICDSSSELLMVAAAACAVYLNGLTGEFLVDDVTSIKLNYDVTGLRPAANLWWNDYWGTDMKESGSHKSYRPLVMLTFRVTYSLWEEWTFPYHATNLVLHIMVTCFFTIFCKKMVFVDGGRFKHGSYVAGLLFAWHPAHVEAVTALAGRVELMVAFFAFLSIFAYHKSYHVGTENSNHDDIADSNWKYAQLHGTALPLNAGDCTSTWRRFEESDVRVRKRKGKNVNSTKSGGRNTRRKMWTCVCAQSWKQASWTSAICWMLVSILLSWAAFFCKETGVTVLGIIIVLDFVHHIEKKFCKAHPLQCLVSKQLAVKMVFIISSGCAMIYFKLWMNGRDANFRAGSGDNPAASTDSLLAKFLTYAALPWVNLWILIFPKFLCWDWGYGTVPLFTSLLDERNIFTVIFYCSLFAVFGFTYKSMSDKSKNFRPLATSLTMLVIPYLPMSHIFMPVGLVLAERCLYLPSAGYIIFITFLWCTACRKHPHHKQHFEALLSVVMVMYITRTVVRNFDWQTEDRLIRSGFATNPRNAKVVHAYADRLHYHAGDIERAIRVYENALELDSNHSDAMAGLAHIYSKRNTREDAEKAEDLLIRGIAVEPNVDQSYYVLADLYLRLKFYENAANVLHRAVRTCGRIDARAIEHYANLLRKAGQLSGAKRVVEQLLCRVCDNDPLCAVPDLRMCGTDTLMTLNVYMHTEWGLGNKQRTYEILKRNTEMRGGVFQDVKDHLFPECELPPAHDPASSKSSRAFQKAKLFTRNTFAKKVKPLDDFSLAEKDVGKLYKV